MLREGTDLTHLPTAEDCVLVIEISDNTLRFDQRVKLLKYALSGIPEYWILDLNKRRLEVYRVPEDEDYLERTTLKPGQTVRALAFPEIEVRWDVALMDQGSTDFETSLDDSSGLT